MLPFVVRHFWTGRPPARSLAIAFALAILVLSAPPRQAVSSQPSAPELETVRGESRVANAVVSHESSDTWYYGLTAVDTGFDQFAEAQVTVAASGVVEPPAVIAREFEHPGENDPAYDAGLLLRYQKVGEVEDYYRVQISAAAGGGEVSLWRPTGGYLAVKQYPFKEKQTYRIRAEAAGDCVRVLVDGTCVLTYRDLRPARGGRPGIAALRGIVSFENVRFGEAGAAKNAPYRRTGPDFSLRAWNKAHPGAWIFDGDEPVARFVEKPVARLETFKLRPGVAPSIGYAAFVVGPEDDQRGLRIPDKIEQLSQGQTLGLTVRLRDSVSSGARADYRMVLRYDRPADAYRYNYTVSVAAPVDRDWDWGKHYNFEWFDPWPMAARGLADRHRPTPYQRYAQVAWQSPVAPQAFRRALMQDYYANFPNTLTAKERTLVPGGLALLGVDPLANPAVKITQTGGLPHYLEVCDFGYDLHFRVGEDTFGSGLPAGSRFEIKWILYPETERSARAMIAAARELSDVPQPVVRAAMDWPKTDFTNVVDVREPHNEATWRGGRLESGAGPGGRVACVLLPGERLALDGNFMSYPETLLSRINNRLLVEARAADGTGEITVELDTKSPYVMKRTVQYVFTGREFSTREAELPGLSEIEDGKLALVNTGGSTLVLSSISVQPRPQVPGVYEIAAESLAGVQGTDLVQDDRTENGVAVRFGPENFSWLRSVFGPYDLSMPPGDYLGMIRLRLTDADPETALTFDVNQTDGVVLPVPVKLRLNSGIVGAQRGYRNVLFAFHRDPGGRLNVRFYNRQGQGTFVVDSISFSRIADGFGNRLEGGERLYDVHCRSEAGAACVWATANPLADKSGSWTDSIVTPWSVGKAEASSR